MKILILTSSDPYKTAGVVALDLYKALSKNNEIKIITKVWGKYPNKNIIPFQCRFYHYTNIILKKSNNLIRRINFFNSSKNSFNDKYSIQDYDQTITYYSSETILKKANFKPDVIITLFMQNFISFKNLWEINKITNAPIYLYMMDMASMTGCCHYAWDCKNYYEKCGKCPALKSENKNDQTKINWEYKDKYIRKTNITAIAASELQYLQLTKSSLFREKNKAKIILGIDKSIFKPEKKSIAREQINLPINKKIIFFGAVDIYNKRKGFNELIKALNIFKENVADSSNILLAIAGNRNKNVEINFPFEYTFLGYLNYNQLSIAFQSSDLFLCPSIEDSGPMMINQSIMCGTPVVSFEIGVASDLVINGETGYKAKQEDCKDLAFGIMKILELDENELYKMSLNCREIGLRLCNSENKGIEWESLFYK